MRYVFLNSQSNSVKCGLISIALFDPEPMIDIDIVIVEAVVLLDKANTVLKCE